MQKPSEIADFQKLGVQYRGNPIFLHKLMLNENEPVIAKITPISVPVPEIKELETDKFFEVPQSVLALSTVFSKIDFKEYFNLGPEQIQINENVLEKILEIENESISASPEQVEELEVTDHSQEEFLAPTEEIHVTKETIAALQESEKQTIEDTKVEFNDFVSWLTSLNKKAGEQPEVNIQEKPPSESVITEDEESLSEEGIELRTEKNRAKIGEPASEPLAELLYSQGYKSEAIKMYELLMLRIPNKSATFADRIKKIKASKK